MMVNKKYDIYGIGSALMDILVEVDDGILENLNIKKGTMSLIDRNKCDVMIKEIEKHKSKKVPGGSAANCIAVCSQLGLRSVFCGVVGKDINGGIYREVMEDSGITTNLAVSDNMTGHAITFITSDHERSFAVHLGAALDLDREHIQVEELRNSKILHVEGYLIGEPGGLKDAALDAMDIAKKNEVLVSLDLSDPNIVKNNRKDLRDIIKKYADIVFANEAEAKELTGKDAEDSLHEIAELADIAIVKLGKNGSLIKRKGNIIKINAYPAEEVDTTGAGDSYAAGVLYGIAKGISLETAAKLGSYLAAKVVGQIGARLEKIEMKEANGILK